MSKAPQPDWGKIAKAGIAGRKWDVVRSAWESAAIGFEFNGASDLSDSVEAIITGGLARESPIVFAFQGGKISAFQDMAAAVHKCAYVLRAVGNCLLSGQPTWASVDSYHFSLLASRALLALLGVHIVKVRETSAVLDVFPEGIAPQVAKVFAKQHRDLKEPARLSFRHQQGLIEQRHVWTILARTLRVSSLPDSISRDASLLANHYEGLGKSRNAVLYNNSDWPYQEDLLAPSLSFRINDDAHSYTEDEFNSGRDASFGIAMLLVRIILGLVGDIPGIQLFDSSYGRCLAKFAGFAADQVDTLYKAHYHQAGYGLDL
jgi:hypothetical protein